MSKGYEIYTLEESIEIKRTTTDWLSIRYDYHRYFERAEMKQQKRAIKKYRESIDTCSFFQHIRIIFDWARAEYDLTREQIELILYLHPLGIFSKEEAYKELEIYPCSKYHAFAKLVKKEMIVVYERVKVKRKQTRPYYALSHKSKKMVKAIYSYTVGEKEFKTHPRYLRKINRQGTDSDKYDEILAKFNQKIRDEDEN